MSKHCQRHACQRLFCGRACNRCAKTFRSYERRQYDLGPARTLWWWRGFTESARARFAWDSVKRARREEERADAEYQQQMDDDIADETRRGLRSTFGYEYNWGAS